MSGVRRLGVQTTKDAQPFSPITRRTRRSLRERQQSAIAPITCGTLTVKGWGRYLLADWSAHSESEHAPTGPGRWAIVRELTRRTRGKSLAQIVKELSVYLTGWRGYFDFCETPSMLRDLDQWTRRRLRAIAWKQWKRGTTRFAELRRRGVGRDLAAQTAGSPHGPWRLSNSPALTIALPNALLASLGLTSLVANKAA